MLADARPTSLFFRDESYRALFAYGSAQLGETAEAYGRRPLMLWRPNRGWGQSGYGLHRGDGGRCRSRRGGAGARVFRRIREVCDRYGVLLILDEVMCGAGRTGTFLACEQDGVVPDLVTLAKGLAGGYQPIGAVLCSDEVYAAFSAGTGAFVNGHTYSAHAIACAAALRCRQ